MKMDRPASMPPPPIRPPQWSSRPSYPRRSERSGRDQFGDESKVLPALPIPTGDNGIPSHRGRRISFFDNDPCMARASQTALSDRSRGTVTFSPSSNTSASNNYPTSAITFHSSNHGRMRRQQRNIGIRDLQAAVKYGKRTRCGIHRNGNPKSKYIFNGVTYIVDDVTKHEITSFAQPIALPYKSLTAEMHERHRMANVRNKDKKKLKSHSVFLVDTSGSMRNSDVNGSRTRLDAVWICLAQDFVAQRIDTGTGGDADIVTVILMGEKPYIHPDLNRVPTDWVLYNNILRINHEKRVPARGHACYGPALAEAERIFSENDSPTCALVLGILSDGRPSDAFFNGLSWDSSAKSINARTEAIASKLGRRLTVMPIGMGSADQFDILQKMSTTVKDYGCSGQFQLPSLTCSGLGAAMSSIATSLTETQTALSEEGKVGAKQRRLRPIGRENICKIPLLTEVVDEDEFDIFMGDSVEHMMLDPLDASRFIKAPFQHPESKGLAVKKKAFGEGTERIAFQCFEVEGDGISVVGRSLVAKESRFVEEKIGSHEFNWEDRDKFVKRFCTIQYQAKKVAAAFNQKLSAIPRLDPDTARVVFINCSVYYLNDEKKGEFAVIVEPKLDGNFEKWNSNNGWHRGKRNARRSTPTNGEQKKRPALGTISEEGLNANDPICIDEAEDEDYICVSTNDVAQAFSHFSYIHSGKKMLVCDLQGVFDRPKRCLRFTDPVIHYHDAKKQGTKSRVYGRTDRGEKGIHDFFKSHVCSGLCDLMLRGFITPKDNPQKRPRSC